MSAYLLDYLLDDFRGPTLPSNGDMLRYQQYLRQVHPAGQATRESVSRCYELWQKAGIATAPMSYAIAQMENLANEYQALKKQWSCAKEDAEMIENFRDKLNVLFFVGRKDCVNTCNDAARKLLVASLTMHLSRNAADTVKRVKDEMDALDAVNQMEEGFDLIKEECEVSFEASDIKSNIKVKNENHINEHYASYLFEEEWNKRYPTYNEPTEKRKFDDKKITPIFDLYDSDNLFCVYCYHRVENGLKVQVYGNLAEYTCLGCSSVNVARS